MYSNAAVIVGLVLFGGTYLVNRWMMAIVQPATDGRNLAALILTFVTWFVLGILARILSRDPDQGGVIFIFLLVFWHTALIVYCITH